MTIKTITTTLLYGVLCLCPYDLLSQCSSCDKILSGTSLNTTANNETWCITSPPAGTVSVNFNHSGVRIEVCADNVVFNNINFGQSGIVIESWGNNTRFVGTTNFGSSNINLIFHGSGAELNAANVNSSGIDIETQSGGELTINNSWTPNSNELNFLVGDNSTINSQGVVFQAGGAQINDGGTWNVTGTVHVNGAATLVNHASVNISAGLTVQGGVNSLQNMCGESGITIGGEFNVSTTGAITNNGSITSNTVRFNSNAGPLNMGNGSSLIVSNNLVAQNTTNVLSYTGDADKCARFTIGGIGNWNNDLTNSSLINYCGPAAGSRPGSASLGCTCSAPVDLCNITLPVDYLSFSVSQQAGGNMISWVTLDEINNNGFEVLTSKNGVLWESLGFVTATSDITNRNEYHYFDDQATSGIAYYQLKQIDHDGTENLSSMKVIGNNEDVSLRLISNPLIEKQLNIVLNNTGGKQVSLRLHDLKGRLVYSKNYSEVDQELIINEQLSQGLVEGVYVLTAIVNDKLLHQKIKIE